MTPAELLPDLAAAIERTIQKQLKITMANEQSNYLFSIQDIADYIGLSYDYVYKTVITQPDFPPPVRINGKISKGQSRRWQAKDIVRHFQSGV